MSVRTRAAPGPYRPSVTRVLRSTLSSTEAALLQHGHGSAAPGAPHSLTASRARGETLHAMARDFMRGRQREPVLRLAVEEFWPSLRRILEGFKDISWADGGVGALAGELELARDDFFPGLRGCPDIVGVRGGVRQVVEIKTARTPYRRHAPADGVIELPDARLARLKLREAIDQVGGYSLLCQERGIPPQEGVVLVALPGRCQQFVLKAADLRAAEASFLARLATYAKQLEAEANELAKGLRLAACDGLKG